jgi:hypothetical protein
MTANQQGGFKKCKTCLEKLRLYCFEVYSSVLGKVGPSFLGIFQGSRCYVRLDFVRQFKLKKSCSTTFKSCDVRLGFSLTWKQQLSNIKLVELNQENNYVRLMLISTKAFFLSFFLLKLKLSLTS